MIPIKAENKIAGGGHHQGLTVENGFGPWFCLPKNDAALNGLACQINPALGKRGRCNAHKEHGDGEPSEKGDCHSWPLSSNSRFKAAAAST